MSQKILLFAGFLIISLSAFAQNTGIISGKVLDARTKEPLIGTNVIVLDTERGASTDMDGKYIIKGVPVGTYRLRFDYIGYKSVFKTDIVVISANPVYVDAELTETSIEGEEVVVTAGYFVEEDKVQPSTIGLSREEIRRFPGGFEDVVRTVSTLPGVAINSAGGRNDLLVRGGGPSENLYLVNNIEVPNINHFGTQGNSSGSLSFVNLDFVKDVSFSTGGFGAQYGDKMSSVLSLTMADYIPDNFESKWTVSATQYGFNFNKPFSEKGNLIFSARKSYLDLIFKAAGLPFVPVYTDFNIIMNYELSPKDRIFFLGLSAINSVDRDQTTLQNRVKNAGLLDNSQYQGISGLNYRRLLNSGYLDFTLGSNLFRYRFSQIDENEQEYFKSDADEWENSLKIQHFWVASKTIGVRSGVSAKFIRNENTTVFADTIYDRSGNRVPVAYFGIDPLIKTNTSAQKYAAFTEADWLVHPRLDVSVGFRADYYEFLDEKLYLAPRLSMKYKMTDRLSLRASSGIYYQSPSYVWVTNPFNKQLKALKNQMVVGGLDYLCRTDLRISLEGFYKKYSQLPGGIVPGVTDYVVLNNTGTGFGGREDDFQSFGYFDLTSTAMGEAFGAELLLQKKFSQIPLYGLMSFTYGKSEVTANNGITYPGQYDQRFIFNLTGGYIFNSKWEVSGKFRYYTGVPFSTLYRPSDNPVNPGYIQNLPGEYLASRTQAGHHLDLRVDRYFNFSSWTLIVYLDIQNIYDYKIPQRPIYDFWQDKISSSSSIGILPSIGISAEF
ncbi:carboxypeptidase-like regulatory domain-containing protein [candidate division KSB1 bacterium]|nr:carboxypeptidase-like regulatory domain-containing protein [candidate division KSB1 bacterium]